MIEHCDLFFSKLKAPFNGVEKVLKEAIRQGQGIYVLSEYVVYIPLL